MAEPRKAKEDVPAGGGSAQWTQRGWMAYLLRVRIRAEDDWVERGNQSDCLHDEDLVSPAIATGGVDSRVCKVALRACGSMPTRQHNQRRSQLLHRLAREHKDTWRHSPSLRELYRPNWSCRSRWPRSSCGSSAQKVVSHESLSSPPPRLSNAVGKCAVVSR